DGADVVVRRADNAFRAVALPPGRHEVEFTFTPRGLRAGAAITLAALAIVGVLLLPRRRAAVTIRRRAAARVGADGGGAARAAVRRASVAPVDDAGGPVRRRRRRDRAGVGTGAFYAPATLI